MSTIYIMYEGIVRAHESHTKYLTHSLSLYNYCRVSGHADEDSTQALTLDS